MKPKLPNKSTRFAYARVVDPRGVTYRLSRRDFTRRLHFAQATYCDGMDRRMFAWTLKALRNELRDRVDGIELEALGVYA